MTTIITVGAREGGEKGVRAWPGRASEAGHCTALHCTFGNSSYSPLSARFGRMFT